MEVAGVGPDYTAWQTAPVSGAGATWSVRITPGRTRGACGLYAGDGATQLVVTLDH